MPTYYTQPLLVTLLHCPPPGLYLRWLSPLGNWEGHLFAGDVDTSSEVTDATSYRPGTGRYQVAVRRPGYDTQTVRSGLLTTAQHAALTTVLDSPQVYQQQPGGQRVPVYVVPGSVARTSSDGLHEISFAVQLPARNALTN